MLRAEAPHYASLLTLEMGKVAGGAHGEVALAAAILDYYAQHGEAFMTPASVPGAPGAKVLTLPLGILLAVEPWHFPYYPVARAGGIVRGSGRERVGQ